MHTILRLALVMALLGSVAGCASAPEKSAGATVDDALTTAAVKTRLAREKLSTLTRIDVDTNQGIVSLNGVVENEDVRYRAGEAARQVGGVRGVVNNLRVQAAAPTAPPAPVYSPPVTPATPAVLDRDNRWRAADATLDGTLSDIRRRATREAALQNRAVAYESVDGFQRVEAYPLAAVGPTGCRQVQERIYQNGRLAQDGPTEVCR
ncbi:MAG TPA: BON domain-containing protein [Methylomirabilota bacterium]|jgi:hyperosmotically inducible protein|nr:BON domain-containing protein [Methylomirabilota bacterium]